MAILRTRTPAIQVQTLPLEGPQEFLGYLYSIFYLYNLEPKWPLVFDWVEQPGELGPMYLDSSKQMHLFIYIRSSIQILYTFQHYVSVSV